jgi:hypothetical protein
MSETDQSPDLTRLEGLLSLCPNPAGRSKDDALIHAIMGHDDA